MPLTAVEQALFIAIAACQFGIFAALLAVRKRFVCAAEFMLIVLGMGAICIGSVLETETIAGTWVRLLGWLSFLIGIMMQFFVTRRIA